MQSFQIALIWPYGVKHSAKVAGTFSNWDLIPLQKSSNVYSTILSVSPGEYHYKFIIDNNWVYDPALPHVDDGYGGHNNVISVVSIQPVQGKVSALPGKGKVTQEKPVEKGSNPRSEKPAVEKGSNPRSEKPAEVTSLPPEIEAKYQLLRSVGEECVMESELSNLLLKKPSFRLYDGFEPSGRMHIAQGVFKAMNVNKCTKSGGTFVFWVADWFALMNDKMGGDLDKIQTVGKYLIEVWKAVGMDMEHVEFLWTSEEITKHAVRYWGQALDIARRFSTSRVTKCCTIMGRAENNLTAAQILYPIMQCTDIFFLRADICQLGVDQRKVNMLAREYCDAAGIKLKPIILSHHMLYGLKKGQAKMSKSDPMSAIFMEDTDQQIRDKIEAAYCPLTPEEGVSGEVTDDGMRLTEDPLMNPCLDYARYIIFSVPGSKMHVGDKTFDNYDSFRESFLAGNIPEKDFKESLIRAISSLIKPVRDHFENDPEAKQLLKTILGYKKDEQTQGKFRRMEINQTKEPWLIFGPLASANFDLGSILTLGKLLQVPPAGAEVILYLPDWSSFTLNCVGGEQKVIASAYSLLVEALMTYFPNLRNNVRVFLQSEAILTNPNDYWISVINVGRKFSLGRIREVDENNDKAAHVISSLMHVGDVLGCSAAHIVSTPVQEKLNQLAIEYCNLVKDRQVTVPKVHVVSEINAQLKEVTEGFDDPDLFLLPFIDTQADVSRKLKKAFCAPQNVDFNPPLVLAKEVSLNFQKKILVKRPADNGGDKEYTDIESLRSDFRDNNLHPGDLKPAVSKSIDEFLSVFREVLKKGKDTAQKVNDIKNYNKKQAADKKKNK